MTTKNLAKTRTSPAAVLAASCLLASKHVAAVCDNNAINYSGVYDVTYTARSGVNAENEAIALPDFTAQFVITTPPGEQAPSERYWMSKYTDNAAYNATDAIANNAEIAAQVNGVDTLCVAAPHDDAGLDCADIDDAGLTALQPLEVDLECNLVKAWSIYLEPATPGCDDPTCRPATFIRNFKRVGSEGATAISVANGSVGMGLSLMLSAAAGLVALMAAWA